MRLTPEQCQGIARFLLANADLERPITRNVIAALPPGQEDYRPDPISMPALILAWHIASSELWFYGCIAAGKFTNPDPMPDSIKTSADVIAWMNAHVEAARASIDAVSAEQLAASIDFFGAMNVQGVHYLSLMLKHCIHHRGQLSSYLRPAGGKVPNIYGPTAEDN